MMITDLGKTFGRANTFNKDGRGVRELQGVVGDAVWKKGSPGCVGNLPGSFTGRWTIRVSASPDESFSPACSSSSPTRSCTTSSTWPASRGAIRAPPWTTAVNAFKQKRAEIVDRRCAS